MNYLKNIIKFESFAELNELSDKSYRLWHVLMSINNSCNWIYEFKVPLKVLKSRLNTESKTTIYNARNQLVQLGLLKVTPGQVGKPAKYQLIPLVQDDGTNLYQDSVPDNGLSSVPNSGHEGVPNSDPLYKQNKTKQNKTNTSDKSQPTRHDTKKKFDDDSTEMKLAMYLFAKIKENNPEHRPLTDAQKQSWADHIRLMMQRDKRTAEQIKGMIDWCQQDNFWKNNILSTAKLRKQYDTMKPKANADYQQRPAGELSFEERFKRSQQRRGLI